MDGVASEQLVLWVERFAQIVGEDAPMAAAGLFGSDSDLFATFPPAEIAFSVVATDHSVLTTLSYCEVAIRQFAVTDVPTLLRPARDRLYVGLLSSHGKAYGRADDRLRFECLNREAFGERFGQILALWPEWEDESLNRFDPIVGLTFGTAWPDVIVDPVERFAHAMGMRATVEEHRAKAIEVLGSAQSG